MAVVLAVVSCQKDVDSLDVNVGGEQLVNITVGLPEATRAASGSGFDLASLEGSDYELRYILEIYVDGNSTDCIRQEVFTTATKEVVFPVRLVPQRNYRVVAWADIVPADANRTAEGDYDYYYETSNGLDEVTIIENAEIKWNAMDEYRDAYTKFEVVNNFTANTAINLTLVRPFAKLRVVSTDIKNIEDLGFELKDGAVNYSVGMNRTYNALTGKATNEASKSHDLTYPTPYADDAYETETRRTLFADYIFVDNIAEQDAVQFTLSVYAQDGLLKTTTFNTDIALHANTLTTIIGEVLTEGGNVQIEINGELNEVEKYTVISSASDLLKFINIDGNYILGNDIIVTEADVNEAQGIITRAAATTTTINLNGCTITINNNAQEALVELNDNQTIIFEGEGSINNTGTGDFIDNTNGEIIIAGGNVDTEVFTEQENITNYLDEIVAAFANGGEYTLKGNVTIVEPLTLAKGKTLVLDLGGYTLSNVSTQTGKNYNMIDVNGCTLTVQNGALVYEHKGENMGWNSSTNLFNITAGGVLNLNNVTAKNLGGSDMGFVAHLNNWGEVTLNVENSTLESNYVAVRVFNSGNDMNNVTIKNSTLKGGNYAFWVHNYTFDDFGSAAKVEAQKALLNFDIFNGTNTFVGKNQTPIRYGFTNSFYLNAQGEFCINNATELKALAKGVNNGDYFKNQTVKLVADIDLNNEEWTPIGSAYMDHGFMGNFDGNGFAIKNLKITELTPDSDNYVYAGLFGVTEGVDKDNENYIKNLTIENVTIATTGHIVAAAVAYPYYTNLENITVKGKVNIKGGDYTAGVLAYTRRCVNAKNIAINADAGSVIEGASTIGGVISDIQMNGGLTANYSNFAASGLTIKGTKCVGGISGIISLQALDGATVKNVALVCNDDRTGIVAGADGGKHTLTNVTYENVTGATRIVGATYDKAYYVGKVVEAAGQKAVVFSTENGVKAVSVAELNLNGKKWQDAMDWAAGLGEGWALASMEELNAIYDLRCELNDVLEADNAENALFWEGDELYKKNGSVYYALYMSSTEIPVGGADANGNKYFENRVFFKIFNKLGYSDVLYSAFDCINKYAPLRDNYFARGVISL